MKLIIYILWRLKAFTRLMTDKTGRRFVLLALVAAGAAILSIPGAAHGDVSYVRSNGNGDTSTTLDIGSADTDRLVVVMADDESTGTDLSAVTVDGKSCTLVTIAENNGGLGHHLEMWYIDEDGLGASNGTVTIAITGGDSGWVVHVHLYTGVDQSGPSDFGFDAGAIAKTTVTVSGIDVPADGLVVMSSGQGSGSKTATWTASLTERIDGGTWDPSSADMADASGVETSEQTNKSYVCTWSGGNFNQGAGIVAVWDKARIASVSGTMTPSVTENAIVSGTKTIIITLDGDTWVAAGATFDGVRQDIIDGLDSAQSESTGWNNEVRDKQGVAGVVRTSATVVTITLDAQSAYDISSPETITVTVPASALVTSSTAEVAAPTFDANPVCTFSKRKSITVQTGKVDSGAHTDFPMLVSITDADLKTTANDGDVASYDASTNDPWDIIFRGEDDTACGGADTAPCTLSHEIEDYDAATGELVAWVKVPSIDDGTVIYMYYGSTCIWGSTQNAADVWNDNYIAVWHLNETSGNHADASGNGNTAYPAVSTQGSATGKINGTDDFAEDSDSFIDINSSTSLDALDTMTVEMWIHKYNTGTGDGLLHLYKSDSDQVFFLYENTSHGLNVYNDIDNSGKYDVNTEWIPTINTWYHVVWKITTTTDWKIYVDGVLKKTDDNANKTMADLDDGFVGRIGRTLGDSQEWEGMVDEVRISDEALAEGWIITSYNNQDDPGDIGTAGFYAMGAEAAATAVSLLAFSARGDDGRVNVAWQTAHEINNLGFYLYRATSPWGPFTRLTDRMIPALSFSVMGKQYGYEDTNLTPGRLYYYKLEDVDVFGTHTPHGPIGVDWDGDGLPDDWETAYGLDAGFDDALLDPDGDGLTNLAEYERGTDPLHPDTDGDGILDGQENGKIDRRAASTTHSPTRGVRVLSADDAGITLELRTEAFDTQIVDNEGQAFERLRVADYIHGFTGAVGRPELPLKGILVDLPQGKAAQLTVEQTEGQTHSGHRVYPVPAQAVQGQGATAYVAEAFAMDEAAYDTDAFYPGAVAQLGRTYTFRDQQRVQVLFFPLAFNPVSGELRHYRRIRVRLDFTAAAGQEPAADAYRGVAPWTPPGGDGAAQDSAAPARALWSPPAEGALPDSPVYKILISAEGIYRLTRSYLAGNGVAVDAIDLSQVRLYHLGREVAISLYDQNGDDALDDADYIQFYGGAVDRQYQKYSPHNVYWLTVSGGAATAQRMATIDGSPGSAAVAGNHRFSVHHEQDLWYWAGAPGGDGLDRWFFYPFVMGAGLQGGGNPVDFTVAVPGVDGQGSLQIAMYGVYDTDHEVAVSVNGTAAGTYTWRGIAYFQAAIDAVNLLEGNNIVTLQCNSGVDSIGVDWIEVNYPRNFAANNNLLKFSYAAGYRYQISGFAGSDLMAFDITSADDAAQVVDFQTTGSGPYTLEFEDAAGAAERTYLALSSAAVMSPDGVSRDTASTLSDTANGADYILITQRDLGWDENGDTRSWLSDLVALRRDQGLRVTVVDVQDVYDEFSYGMDTPQAVKDFLSYTYTNWAPPAPQYVLLVGDSTYDVKNNWSWFFPDTTTYLTTYLAFTEHQGETATDEWFVRVSGDDAVPDMYIGRLPAKSAAEASVMVAKIIAYESAPNTKTWQKNVVLVADNQTEDYEAVFETLNEDAAALIPAGFNAPFKGYLDDYLAAGDLADDIKEKINEGALLVNYSGHGALQLWANESIFSNADVADLTNGQTLPFFINMACLTGYFVTPEAWGPGGVSLAEVLLRSEDRGAVAALMPTGLTAPAGQHILDTAFFDAVFTEDIRSLGPAIAAAKQTLLANGASQYEELSETFVLFGDPAMGLKIPLPRRPAGLAAQAGDSVVGLQWQAAADCNGGAVEGYNVYRSKTAGGLYVKINTAGVNAALAQAEMDALVTATEYSDSTAENDTTYYYVLAAVDSDGDESVRSVAVSATPAAPFTGGSSGDGGCFIAAAAEAVPWLWWAPAAFGVIFVIMACMRRKA